MSEDPAEASSSGQALADIPPDSVLTMYCDGASRGNPGQAGAGAVLMTEDGTEIEHLRLYLGHGTNNEAEYRAVILGLETAVRYEPSRLDIYLDSQLVVRQLLGRYKVKHPNLIPLHAQASKLIKRLRRCTLNHVERAKNSVADRLANEAIDRKAL